VALIGADSGGLVSSRPAAVRGETRLRAMVGERT